MKFVDSLLELIKQLLLFLLKILELLQPNLILPLDILQYRVLLHDISLRALQTFHNSVVFNLLFAQSLNFLTGFLEGLNDLFVSLFLVHLLLLFCGIFFLRITKLILQLLNYIKVCVCYLLVVVLYVLVLLCMLLCKFFDSIILLVLDSMYHRLSLLFHLSSE